MTPEEWNTLKRGKDAAIHAAQYCASSDLPDTVKSQSIKLILNSLMGDDWREVVYLGSPPMSDTEIDFHFLVACKIEEAKNEYRH